MASVLKIRTISLVSSFLLAALLITIAIPHSPAHARDVLFWGITDARGEPALAEMEREMRAELAASHRFRLIGEAETRRIIRESERQGHTRSEAFIPKGAKLADSAVVVRCVVKEFAVAPARSGLLIWGKVDARMTLEVFFGEVSGPASYRGEFSAAASKRKDVILFASPKTAVHVSATDREELAGRMRSQIIKEVSGLSAVFFNSLGAGAAADGPAAADGAEFSTVDGNSVQPIDSTGVSGGGAAAEPAK
ncbi:MAG: hypothetical protein LBH93_02590 [Chitinispirillales bacterium]|jgi:hypothetical protein|nr:hypothetical protein [Chitinispirillales bacterium]